MEEIVIVGNHLLSSRAIVITEVDKVKLGVCEVDPLGGDVQRKTIGPVDLGGDDGLPLGAVHPDPLNSWVLPPVRPEQPPGALARVESEAARLRDVLVDEDHSIGAVLLRHLYGVEARVKPVNVLGHPVIGQTLNQVNAT